MYQTKDIWGKTHPCTKPDNVVISESKENAKALNMQHTSQFTREPDDGLP